MRMKRWVWLAVMVAALTAPMLGSTQQKSAGGKSGAAGSPGAGMGLKANVRPYVAPDLAERVGRYKRVVMGYDSAGLTAREKKMVEKLVDAAQWLDAIYWRQSDPRGLMLLKSIEGSSRPEDALLRRFLVINGSRFDLLEANKAFVGTAPFSPGRGYYPEGVTRQVVESYVEKHPGERKEIYSPYTIIERGAAGLEAIPYHEKYARLLEPMAKDLKEAAALSDDAGFAKYLRLRAAALLSDDYYPSDIAWVKLKDPKIDLILAPYEVYLDGVLGVKTSYGAAVLIRNEEESRRLAVYQKYVPELQEALPLEKSELPSKQGRAAPMEVMDAPYRAGDLLHGYQAVADNLPNDPRVHMAEGSKEIFFKNFMDARVEYIVLPIAERLMKPEQARLASGEGYLAATMMHEISHGLGPSYAKTAKGQEDIREAIGQQYSALEEAKADVAGMYGLKWLTEHGGAPAGKMDGYYAAYVAGILRSVRFGTAEAHGSAEMMEFNYLSERKAIAWEAGSGRYAIDFGKMPAAITALAHELLEMEATGDRKRAEAWFAKYGSMPGQLGEALKRAADIPVDIEPEFAFATPVR